MNEKIFQAETYYYDILEKTGILSNKLKDATGWWFDTDAGQLSFTIDEKKVFYDAQLIGSFSEKSRGWMWGWANERFNIEQKGLSEMREIKKAAGEHGQDWYLSEKEIFVDEQPAMSEQMLGEVWIPDIFRRFVIVSVGIMEYDAVFNAVVQADSVNVEGYYAVKNVGESDLSEFDLKYQTIKNELKHLFLVEKNYRLALKSYLGEPTEDWDSEYIWNVDGRRLLIQFESERDDARIVTLKEEE